MTPDYLDVPWAKAFNTHTHLPPNHDPAFDPHTHTPRPTPMSRLLDTYGWNGRGLNAAMAELYEIEQARTHTPRGG